MSWRVAACVALPAFSLLAGCRGELEVEPHQSCVIAAAGADEVLLAGARILQREFGRVRIDREARRVETEPVEFRTTRESGTARDLYRGPSTMRKLAHLQVSRRGADAIARLRIDVERQDTARVANLHLPTGRFGDSPAYTPIERDAATTDRQNTVWTKVRRDLRQERALLDELRESFARATVPATQTAATQPARPEPQEQP
jgi:hypothetical protein